MCGLTGVASTEKLRNAKSRRDSLFDAIWCNTLRGDHSTGIAAIPHGKELEEPVVYKKAMNGPDFLGTIKARQILSDIEKYSILIGHNRASTTGAAVDRNAHPFIEGHITLTHNGHVSNAFTLLPHNKKCLSEVDSGQVAAAMAEIGEKETLERCTGAFAFVWHNAKDGTLNFARNAGRPLKFCYIKEENTMWWMSERVMLVSVLDRQDVKIDGTFYNVPESVWYKFKVDNLREYSTTPFTHRLQGTGRPAIGTGGMTQDRPPMVNRHGSHITGTDTTTKIGSKPAFSEGVKLANIQGGLILDLLHKMPNKPPKTEIDKREFLLKKNSCRPTGIKKIQAAKDAVARTGFHYDQLVVVEVKQWRNYKNQEMMGATSGVVFNTQVPVHLASISKEDSKNLRNLAIVLGRVVNVKPREEGGGNCLVVEVHPLATEFSSEWSKRWTEAQGRALARAALNQQHPKLPFVQLPTLSLPAPTGGAQTTPQVESVGPVLGSSGDVGDSSPLFLGPSNRSISRERYMELTKVGCAMCTGDLPSDPEGSKKLFWIDDAAVCKACASNPDTMQKRAPEIKHNLLH